MQPTAAPKLAGFATILAAVAVLGMGLAIALTPVERPAWELVAAGLGLLGLLAFTVVAYGAGTALGFLLFAVVRVEPAPADAVFAVVIAVALATGRFNLRTTPLGPALGIAVFILLNLVACFDALDPARAASFMSITVYLCAFGLWVASYVTDQIRARRILRVYLGMAGPPAGLGPAAVFLPLPGHDALTSYQGTRARGLFKDPNVFGP